MSKSKYECNRDCFNCIFEDCIRTDVTFKEQLEQDLRDVTMTVPSNDTVNYIIKVRKRKGNRF